MMRKIARTWLFSMLMASLLLPAVSFANETDKQSLECLEAQGIIANLKWSFGLIESYEREISVLRGTPPELLTGDEDESIARYYERIDEKMEEITKTLKELPACPELGEKYTAMLHDYLTNFSDSVLKDIKSIANSQRIEKYKEAVVSAQIRLIEQLRDQNASIQNTKQIVKEELSPRKIKRKALLSAAAAKFVKENYDYHNIWHDQPEVADEISHAFGRLITHSGNPLEIASFGTDYLTVVHGSLETANYKIDEYMDGFAAYSYHPVPYTSLVQNYREYVSQYEDVDDSVLDGEYDVDYYRHLLETFSTDAETLGTIAADPQNLEHYVKLGKSYETKGVPGIKIFIKGNRMVSDVQPTMVGNFTFVPLRAIAEALQAEVEWDAPNQTAEFSKDGRTVNITINETIALLDGQKVVLDAPAMLIGGRTMVPLRFIGESLGVKVDWIQEGTIVVIN